MTNSLYQRTVTTATVSTFARQGTVCLVSAKGQARTSRIEKLELDEGFQPYHPPFRRIIISVTTISSQLLSVTNGWEAWAVVIYEVTLVFNGWLYTNCH